MINKIIGSGSLFLLGISIIFIAALITLFKHPEAALTLEKGAFLVLLLGLAMYFFETFRRNKK